MFDTPEDILSRPHPNSISSVLQVVSIAANLVPLVHTKASNRSLRSTASVQGRFGWLLFRLLCDRALYRLPAITQNMGCNSGRPYPDRIPKSLRWPPRRATWPTLFFQEMTKKIEENFRLNEDARDALYRAQQAEKRLEEQVQNNARMRERLESARLEVARCQEAVDAAEAKAARHESVSAELQNELRSLRGQVTAAVQRLQALGDDLAKSNERVNEAKARVREIEQVLFWRLV